MLKWRTEEEQNKITENYPDYFVIISFSKRFINGIMFLCEDKKNRFLPDFSLALIFKNKAEAEKSLKKQLLNIRQVKPEHREEMKILSIKEVVELFLIKDVIE